MIKRNLESQIKKYAAQYPVLSIVGPRQSGKTTLARYLFPNCRYVSLENFDKASRTYSASFKDNIVKWFELKGNTQAEGLILFNGEDVMGSQSKIPAVPWWQL